MGDVVALPGTAARNSFSRSNVIPDWPHPRAVTISIERARAIDRDIRHLDDVMNRAADIEAISTILLTTCGPEGFSKDDVAACEAAARAIGAWLRTGRHELGRR